MASMKKVFETLQALTFRYGEALDAVLEQGFNHLDEQEKLILQSMIDGVDQFGDILEDWIGAEKDTG